MAQFPAPFGGKLSELFVLSVLWGRMLITQYCGTFQREQHN